MPSIYNFTNSTHTVEFYGSLGVCIFGTITNLANLQVSSRKEMRLTTMGFYNILISMFNLLIIYFNLTMFFPQSIGRTQVINTSTWACILIPYLFRVFSYKWAASGWVWCSRLTECFYSWTTLAPTFDSWTLGEC